MKTLIAGLCLSLIFLTAGCGCKGESPTVTLVNNTATKANIQIKTSNGNTENINNVDPGWRSAARPFASGSIEFTIAIQGVVDPIVYTLPVGDCTDYVLLINADNTVSVQRKDR
jgi:hypothetical protein